MPDKDLRINSKTLLTLPQRAAFLESLTPQENEIAQHCWPLWARDTQLAPTREQWLALDSTKQLIKDWQENPDNTGKRFDESWRTWLFMAGRGSGKLLNISTEVLTASGVTTIGEIQVGTTVFDETGAPCQVTAVHPISYNCPCLKVTFNDGSTVVTDADHLWTVHDKRYRKSLGRRVDRTTSQFRQWPISTQGPRTLTTRQMQLTLYHKSGDINYAIPTHTGLDYPPADLPIDPYTLGAWLGDGTANDGIITTALCDHQIIEEIPYDTKQYRTVPPRCPVYSVIGLKTKLRELGVLKNKHIPEIYLTASFEQRLALLQGLNDTDGTISPDGRIEFCQKRDRLSAEYQRLVESLGIVTRHRQDPARLYGKDYGIRHRFCYTTLLEVFRLARKRARLPVTQQDRYHYRFITAIESAPSVPVRCIGVDSRSRLFLVTTHGIATHNTRSGAEWIREQIEDHGISRVALVGPTAADVRDVMVEGSSGILSCCPPWNRPSYLSSKRKVEWPNGAVALMYSAEDGDRLRGAQPEKAWCDELTSWGDDSVWDMLLLGLRLGKTPQAMVTTTSKIGHRLLKNILNDPWTVKTKGHTFDNIANLSSQFIEHIRKKYEGTRLGKQELEGEYLEEGTGVLWSDEGFIRMETKDLDMETMARVVVAIDPSITTSAEGAETGIMVVGRDEQMHAYVLADHSGHYSPNGWAEKAIDLYKAYRANMIVAEVNNGGDMVLNTIRNMDPGIACKKVVATRGKRIRAEPISMLYEQGRVTHVGNLSKLEAQQIDFNPENPNMLMDRVDAVVWGLTELIIHASEIRIRSL